MRPREYLINPAACNCSAASVTPSRRTPRWMDAVMDWHLVYRSDNDMLAHAEAIGLRARTFHDPTDSIVFCEMTDD